MKIIEAIQKSGASILRNRSGEQLAVAELLARYTTEGDDLHRHRLDNANVLEVDGKKLVCSVDSQGRMRRDRWVYEVLASSDATQTDSKTDSKTDEKKDDTVKTAQATKSPKVAKAIKNVQEQLKKKDNRNGTHPCMCGCGDNCERMFRQGHDAKLKSQLIAHVRENGPKPSTLALKAVQEYLAVAPWMTTELKKAVLN